MRLRNPGRPFLRLLLERALLVKIAIAAGILLPTAALLPSLGLLRAESQFADALEALATSESLGNLKDFEIRSSVQKLARSQRFHIEFEDIFIEYSGKDKETNMLLPTKLGYTLHMVLPVFGVLPLPIVAVRTFPVRLGRTNAGAGSTSGEPSP